MLNLILQNVDARFPARRQMSRNNRGFHILGAVWLQQADMFARLLVSQDQLGPDLIGLIELIKLVVS